MDLKISQDRFGSCLRSATTPPLIWVKNPSPFGGALAHLLALHYRLSITWDRNLEGSMLSTIWAGLMAWLLDFGFLQRLVAGAVFGALIGGLLLGYVPTWWKAGRPENGTTQ